MNQEITQQCLVSGCAVFGSEEITSQHTIENYAFVTDAFLFFSPAMNMSEKLQNKNAK